MRNKSSDCTSRALAKFDDSTKASTSATPPVVSKSRPKPDLRLLENGGERPLPAPFRRQVPLDLVARLRDLVEDADEGGISPEQLSTLSQKWILDRRYQKGLAAGTLEGYALVLERFLWFVQSRDFDECGEEELVQFFAYCRAGRDLDGGRWGHACDGRRSRAKTMSARTVAIHYNCLRAFYNWMVKKGHLMRSPFDRMEPPKEPKKEIKAFSNEDVLALLAAAGRSLQPLRDVAILSLLFDCGLRAQELCDLNVQDVDLEHSTIKIWHGKGDKERTVIFSPLAGQALWAYYEAEPRHPDDPFFVSQRGGPLSPHSLGLLFKRLKEAANITGVRCSPHTMRHSFASSYLMRGGSMEELQHKLGHTDSRMTQVYVHLNVEYQREQHRRFSPLEGLLRPKNAKRSRRR